MGKRETEKLVKEIWKEKLVEMQAGKHTDLTEFIFQHLQKRVGIVATVVEMGTNLLYSAWRYSFDADCSPVPQGADGGHQRRRLPPAGGTSGGISYLQHPCLLTLRTGIQNYGCLSMIGPHVPRPVLFPY